MRKIASFLVILSLVFWQTCLSAAYQMTPRQAIYFHASKGDLPSLRMMIQQGHSVDLVDEKGNSALCEAVWRKNQTAVTALVQAGANVDSECMRRIPVTQRMSVKLSQVRTAPEDELPPKPKGMSTAAKVGIGVGAVALIGGGVALAVGGGGGGGGGSSKKECSGHGQRVSTWGCIGEYECSTFGLCYCTEEGERQFCTCDDGWTGDNCETPVACTGSSFLDSACSRHTECDSHGKTLYTCSECKRGYDLIDNTCIPKTCSGTPGTIPHCKTATLCYSGEDIYSTCTVCDNDYKLSGNTCVPDTTCETYPGSVTIDKCSNETTCTKNGTTYYSCHSCATDYVLKNNTCVFNCLEGSTSPIPHCKASARKSCTALDGSTEYHTCTECESGYTWVSSTQCDANVCDPANYPSFSSSIDYCEAGKVEKCQSASTETYGCSSCQKGYLGRNCETCDTANGYGRGIGTTCVQVCAGVREKNIANCQTYTEPCTLDGNSLWKCQTCSEGFVPSANGEECVPDSTCTGTSGEVEHCLVEPVSCKYGTETLWTCPTCEEGYTGETCATCEEGYVAEGGECRPTCVGVNASESIDHCVNYGECTKGSGSSARPLKYCTECEANYTVNSEGTCSPVSTDTNTAYYGHRGEHNNNATVELSNTPADAATTNYADREIRGVYNINGHVRGAWANSSSGKAESTIRITNSYPEGIKPVYGIYAETSKTTAYNTYGAVSEVANDAINTIEIDNESNGAVYGLYNKKYASFGGLASKSGKVNNTIEITNKGNGAVYGIYGLTSARNASAGGTNTVTADLSITNTGSGAVYGLFGSTGYAHGAVATQNGGTANSTITLNNTGSGNVFGLQGVTSTIGAYTATTTNSTASNQLTINNTGDGTVRGMFNNTTTTSRIVAGAYDTIGGSATNAITIANHGTGTASGIESTVNAYGAYTVTTSGNSNSKVQNTISISNTGTGTIYGIYSKSNSAFGSYIPNKDSSSKAVRGNVAENTISISESHGDVYAIYGKANTFGARADGGLADGTSVSRNTITVDNRNQGSIHGIYSLATAFGALRQTVNGTVTNTVTLTNSGQDTYGLYGGTYAAGSKIANATGTVTNTIDITNTGTGSVYGIYWKGTGTSLSYGSYASKGSSENTIRITNQNTNPVFGFRGASNSHGAYAQDAGVARNNLYIVNQEKTDTLDPSTIYGYHTTGATTYLAYATGANSQAYTTIDIKNDDNERVWGVHSPNTVYGAYATASGNSATTLTIRSGTKSGDVYGFFGSSAGKIIGANVGDTKAATHASNTLSIINLGGNKAYGMYGKTITSSTASANDTNTINMTLIGKVTDNVASGKAIGMYVENGSATNAAGDIIRINSLGGNYQVGDDDTVSAATDNTVAVGIYVGKDASVTNAGTITIERSAWTDDKGTPDDTTDDITYTPAIEGGKGGTAIGIYVKGGNSADKTITNSGTINISGIGRGYGIYVEDESHVKVVNTGTITIADSDNSDYNGSYTAQGEASSSVQRFIVLNGSPLTNVGTLSLPTLNASALNLTLSSGSQTIVKNEMFGTAGIAADTVTSGFATTYTEKDMIQAGDTSGLTLVSESALFDAKLADNGSDVVMTMKGFDTATSNKSLVNFLTKNYKLGNNEEFYNKLKSFGDTKSLTDSLNKLTGKEMLSRFNFEDMTMMRELNFDMNDKLFHNPEQHFALAGSVSPMAFRGDTGSNARYSLYNKRDGNTSIGLGIAFTDVRSDNAHEDDDRYETSYQLILPMGYKTNGFNFVTSPRIGYARGTYDRTGFNDQSYDGKIEKRVFGLMNEARYPITVGKWKLEPSAEFNVLGYQQRGHEDSHMHDHGHTHEGEEDYALNIRNQTTYSVEGGIGLYATREEELTKDSKLKLTAGVAAYHEFADPYRVKVGMTGMDGAFTLRDEKRSDNRGVIRAGFDYSYRDLSLYGSLISYIDREARTSAKTGVKVKF